MLAGCALIRSLTADGCVRKLGRRWKKWAARHPELCRRATLDSGTSYCLPLPAVPELSRIFRVPSEILAAELEFSELCRDFFAIGFHGGKAVSYLLMAHLPRLPDMTEALCTRLGWTTQDAAETRAQSIFEEDVFGRRKSAAGRLLVNPRFQADIAVLRESWLRIRSDRRPKFPLDRGSCSARSVGVPRARDCQTIVDENEHEFDRCWQHVCTEWELNGLTDWHLPSPEGPFWPDLAPWIDSGREQRYRTPGHFPVLKSDGLGRSSEVAHQENLRRRGIDDAMSYQTYAIFLPLIHWKLLLRRRFEPAGQRSGFADVLDAALGVIVDNSVERIRKLRFWISGIKNGRMSSLKGRR